MNLQRVRYFLVFCETLHFTNAAGQLGISQPALTKAIGQLEIDLNTKLIRREGKHTHLTENGVVARNKLSSLMLQVKTTEYDLEQAVNSKKAIIRIAVNRSIEFTRIANFLVHFRSQCPHVFIELVECTNLESKELLLHGKVDCALTTDCEKISNRVSCVELYKYRLAEARPDSNSVLFSTETLNDTLPKLTPSMEVNLTSQIYRQSTGGRIPVAQCSQSLWTQQLIKAGMGVGYLPAGTDLVDGVRFASTDGYTHTHSIFAAIPAGRKDSPSNCSFFSLLRSYNWQ